MKKTVDEKIILCRRVTRIWKSWRLTIFSSVFVTFISFHKFYNVVLLCPNSTRRARPTGLRFGSPTSPLTIWSGPARSGLVRVHVVEFSTYGEHMCRQVAATKTRKLKTCNFLQQYILSNCSRCMQARANCCSAVTVMSRPLMVTSTSLPTPKSRYVWKPKDTAG